jgi:hypothetical protein
MEIDDYAGRVKAAADILDQYAGDWWSLVGGYIDVAGMVLPPVNPDTLNTGDPCNCVAGQLFGDYADTPYGLGLMGHPGLYAMTPSPDGTNPHKWVAYDNAVAAEYAELTNQWRKVIEERRNAGR